MQVYGLVGQTEEGIWPEAQLLYYTESLNKSFYPFVAVIFTIICFF